MLWVEVYDKGGYGFYVGVNVRVVGRYIGMFLRCVFVLVGDICIGFDFDEGCVEYFEFKVII